VAAHAPLHAASTGTTINFDSTVTVTVNYQVPSAAAATGPDVGAPEKKRRARTTVQYMLCSMYIQYVYFSRRAAVWRAGY
jgi:hypothetical protein